MTSKPFKPTLSEASLVGWILDDPEKRFAIHYRNSGGVHLCERTVQRDDGKWEIRRISGSNPSPEDAPAVDKFGGKLKFDPHNLKVAGLAGVSAAATQWPDERKAYEAFIEGIHRPTQWSYDAAIVTLTPAAAAWWESKGRSAQEKLLAKIAQKKAAAAAKERVAVFGCRQNYRAGRYEGQHAHTIGRIAQIVGIAEGVVPKWKGMRPAFSAVITRETETRYYLRDVVNLTDANLRIEGGIGSNVERYIEKNYLLIDNATPEEIARLKAFDDDIRTDYVELRDRVVDEMVPVLIAALERKDQKEAEIDGRFGELVASLRPSLES